MSSVNRVDVSNVLIPRSQRITCEFPSLTMYSAAISRSSTVEDEPRLSSTGFGARPDLGEQREVRHVARADLDHVRDLDDRLDVARIHQLRHERQPGLLARLRRISSASSPRPWNAYGEVRGLNAPPRSIVTPSAATAARGLERLLARLDRARAGDEAEVAVADAAAAHLDHGRIGRELARDELVRLEDRQHLLDRRRSPRAAASRAARARRSRRSRSPRARASRAPSSRPRRAARRPRPPARGSRSRPSRSAAPVRL